MKKFIIYILLCTAFTIKLNAQSAKSTTYKASKIEELREANVVYRYPQFQNGQVQYRDGRDGAGTMNYHLFLKEIHFIGPNGDTLALADLPTVKYLTIGADTFFYNKGVLEVLASYNKVKLAVKEELREVDRQKIGAYGMATSTASIDSYSSLRINQGTYGLSVAEKIVYVRERSFFLYLKESQLLPVNWNNISKAFPGKKNKIEAYAAAEKIDLSKEDDLKKLLSYCDSQ